MIMYFLPTNTLYHGLIICYSYLIYVVLALVIDYEEDVNALLKYIKEGNNSWAAVHKYALSLYDKRDHDEEF